MRGKLVLVVRVRGGQYAQAGGRVLYWPATVHGLHFARHYVGVLRANGHHAALRVVPRGVRPVWRARASLALALGRLADDGCPQV